MRTAPARWIGGSAFGLVLLTFLASGCGSLIQERNPALPPGFRQTLLPDVDLQGYLYLGGTEPLVISSDSLFGESGPPEDVPQLLGVRRVSVWVSSIPRVYGISYQFDRPAMARLLEAKLKESSTGAKYRRHGDVLYRFQGKGDWIESLMSSVAEGRLVTLAQGYPGAWDLYNMLPEAPRGDPLAAGFGLLDGEFLDRLVRDVAPELGVLKGLTRSAKLEQLVFGVYSSNGSEKAEEFTRETILRDPDHGAVVATRSSYPGFLVSFIFRYAATGAGFREVDLSDSRRTEQAFYAMPQEDLHTMMTSDGNLFTISVGRKREMAEDLLLQALDR